MPKKAGSSSGGHRKKKSTATTAPVEESGQQQDASLLDELPPSPEEAPAESLLEEIPLLAEEEATLIEMRPDAVQMASLIYMLWLNWADFSITVVSPQVKAFPKPDIILPGTDFTYIIHDFGNRFTTSKQEDMFSAGKSMCKMRYTIEKLYIC
jgi:hypothetical protein